MNDFERRKNIAKDFDHNLDGVSIDIHPWDYYSDFLAAGLTDRFVFLSEKEAVKIVQMARKLDYDFWCDVDDSEMEEE